MVSGVQSNPPLQSGTTTGALDGRAVTDLIAHLPPEDRARALKNLIEVHGDKFDREGTAAFQTAAKVLGAALNDPALGELASLADQLHAVRTQLSETSTKLARLGREQRGLERAVTATLIDARERNLRLARLSADPTRAATYGTASLWAGYLAQARVSESVLQAKASQFYRALAQVEGSGQSAQAVQTGGDSTTQLANLRDALAVQQRMVTAREELQAAADAVIGETAWSTPNVPVPEVDFVHAYNVDVWAMSSPEANALDPVTATDWETVKSLVMTQQPRWDDEGTKILGEVVRMMGAPFPFKGREAGLAAHCGSMVGSAAAPFTMPADMFIKGSGFGEARWQYDELFIDAMVHEMLHLFVTANRWVPDGLPESTPLTTVYTAAGEAPAVLTHLHVHALQRAAYLRLGMTERLEKFERWMANVPPPDYRRAMELVDIVGHQAFVEDLKPFVQARAPWRRSR